MSEEIGLYYIGKGASLDNIPARDLTLEEVERFDAAALIASGLYSATAPSVIADSRDEISTRSRIDHKVAQHSKRGAKSDRSVKEN